MKKTLKYSLLTSIAICLCFYLYIRLGGYFLIEKGWRENIVTEIKKAPELPDKFYELYELTYPNSLNKGILSCFIEKAVFSNHSSECPALSTANILASPNMYGLKIGMLGFYLQDQVTNKQCVDALTHHFDYLYSNIGITSASQYYFTKELEDLNEKEILTLIIMMENPSLYNPLRRPEKIEEKVNSILERRENKKKSRNLMQLFNTL